MDPSEPNIETTAGGETTQATSGCATATEPASVESQADAAPGAEKPRHPGGVLSSVQSLAATVVIAVFVITFIVQAFQIPSESMEDTLLIGDYLLVDKVHFAQGGTWGQLLPYGPVRRGDIVVFRYPVRPQQHFVKRVIGLPGDRIHLRDKQVYVNGKPLQEKYVVFRSTTPDAYRDDFPRTELLNSNIESRWWLQVRELVRNGELTVPPDRYFVLGDNRDESLDSRYWGFVPRENIIGRPLLIYWSMHNDGRAGPLSDRLGDRLVYFAYMVAHVFDGARWDRAFRLVR
ncbi:MAG: signal peptidase I [Terriglobales bacterium]